MNVSVIIPAYNAAKALADTLESLQAQTFPNWEAIVIGDGLMPRLLELAKLRHKTGAFASSANQIADPVWPARPASDWPILTGCYFLNPMIGSYPLTNGG